ncbi:MAG: F0F1 ATP synthase subunit B [Betaproteobacteria bacterium]|nr:F0F1 ATP synthase subunit B [Betaproteobacteria bacterium]NBP38103.1 F0F1 ATP synthase subunit B [Betaproteobacteria bacterium]
MNINATLIIQIVVFLILWWFTARFVWPPITKALDERSRRISDGLAAADRAKADLAAAELRVQEEMKNARAGAAELRTAAERQAAVLMEQARADASRIVAEARKAAESEADLAAQRVKDQLREEVAALAVAGAARILRREVDARAHAQLLADLKTELR